MTRQRPSWAKTNVSWDTKKAIWVRWALGDKIKDTLDYLQLNADKYKDAPVDRNTINKVRKELNEMPTELVHQLVTEAPEVKTLVIQQRPDFQVELAGLKLELSEVTQPLIPKAREEDIEGVTKTSISKAKEEHFEQIRLLLIDWRRDIRLKNVTNTGVTAPVFPIECEEMFPFVIEHCPSIKDIYEEYKNFDLASFIRSGISKDNLWAIAEVAFNSHGLKIKPELYVDILWNILSQVEKEQTINFRPIDIKGLSEQDQARCHQAQQAIFSEVELDEDERQKCKMVSYYKHLIEGLDKAIVTSLDSHEYLKNRCAWCPE